ncbi:MAG TPA: Stk1 family PASTA domain-containing Ser/Thr kinase [Conexibacter sp.]|jgi:serine/threonine-protein kinase
MTEIAPDTIIDERYKVLSRIGSGGMAEVFCVQDQSLGRKVALKLLYPRFASDAEFVERFRREASSAASLQHPNVVGIYDRGRWDGTYYIAMEYLPGRTLKDLIRQDGPIDQIRAIDLTVQILKAARFAHRRGIVHRDLKPHNVIVDDEDRAKVTDFGIARAGASDMTETGSIMGTAQYLSPEQAQGLSVSPQSDLYAVGVILFELLTGHVPFDAESAVTIALKHVAEPPPSPSAFDPTVAPELEAITLWALEKEPADRPPDADAFIHALEDAREALLGREVPGQRTANFATAMHVNGSGPPTSEADALEAEHRRRRPSWWTWLIAAIVLAGVAVAVVLVTRTPMVTVPNVVGDQLSPAQSRLQRENLTWSVDPVRSTKPVNEVIAQNPGARRSVKEHTEVTLQVSSGPGTVGVPPVDNDSYATAQAALQNAGLVVGRRIDQPSATVDKGLVIKTSPPAGRNVDRGSPVNVYVSTGPAQVTIPDTVGESAGVARATLENAGFDVAETTVPSRTATPGAVVAQTPAGGASADRGALITISVATAVPVAVPQVIGMASDDAQARLVAAGLEPRVSRTPVTDQAQDGIVISQRPDPDTSVRRGAPVRIVVGRFVAPVTPPTPPDNGGGGGGDATPTTPAGPPDNGGGDARSGDGGDTGDAGAGAGPGAGPGDGPGDGQTG